MKRSVNVRIVSCCSLRSGLSFPVKSFVVTVSSVDDFNVSSFALFTFSCDCVFLLQSWTKVLGTLI